MRVRTTDDQLWWVGRRWLPWRPRPTKKSDTDWGDGVTVLGFTPDEPVGCAIGVRRWDGKRLRTLYSGQVKGWRASRELIEQVESEIRAMGAPYSLAPQG